MEALILKLKFQYFGYLMQRAESLEKTLMPGKIEGRKRLEGLELPVISQLMVKNAGDSGWWGRWDRAEVNCTIRCRSQSSEELSLET